MDFLKFTDTGLLAASRQEIYAHLSLLAKQAYGNDISLDEGTAFDSFLQLLSDSLSSVNGSALSFSEIFSSKQASGTFLDFIAGGRGVLRKTKRNQRVVMTVILNNETEKPFLAHRNTLFVKDGGRVWVNTEQLVVQERKFLPDGSFGTEENYQGTCEFGLLSEDGVSLDGYDTDLLTVGTYSEVSPMPFDERTNISLQEAIKSVYNSVNATPAVLVTETDAQLRARYDRAVYAGSMSAVEVLSLALMRLPGIDFVRIVENLTNSTNEYGMDAHSVWCIVGGGSSTNNSGGGVVLSADVGDVSVAQAILNYKSLGCGVSVGTGVTPGTVVIDGVPYYTGNFKVEIPMESMVAEIPFTRVVNNGVSFTVVLDTTVISSHTRDLVSSNISLALQEFVSGLEPGEVITKVDVMGVIQSVLSKYERGKFDYKSHTVTYDEGSGIKIYQKAIGGTASVTYAVADADE